MTPWQFAKELGVSKPMVEGWENGRPITSFDQTKLDRLDKQAESYLRDKLRAQETVDQYEADKQKSEYATELLPDGKGRISVKRR